MDGSHPCCKDDAPFVGCEDIECDCMIDECDSGDIACDSYNNIERDIQLLVNMNVKVFYCRLIIFERFGVLGDLPYIFRITDFLFRGVD